MDASDLVLLAVTGVLAVASVALAGCGTSSAGGRDASGRVTVEIDDGAVTIRAALAASDPCPLLYMAAMNAPPVKYAQATCAGSQSGTRGAVAWR